MILLLLVVVFGVLSLGLYLAPAIAQHGPIASRIVHALIACCAVLGLSVLLGVAVGKFIHVGMGEDEDPEGG